MNGRPQLQASSRRSKRAVSDPAHILVVDDDREIRSLLRKTFSINPNHVHGHFVRAHFLKRQGDHDKALKHFKKVAKLDPKNLEALREVRIGTMRQSRGRTSAPPPSIDGKRPSIFGKFFKK